MGEGGREEGEEGGRGGRGGRERRERREGRREEGEEGGCWVYLGHCIHWRSGSCVLTTSRFCREEGGRERGRE